MKYLELSFNITPYDEAAADVLTALLADAGCDTFLPEATGLTAYILQEAYDQNAIQQAIDGTRDAFPPPLAITFTTTEVPDENWNATWEAEHHFEPIALPDGQTINIIPRQAFGSGEHATTRMMIAFLAQLATAQEPSPLPHPASPPSHPASPLCAKVLPSHPTSTSHPTSPSHPAPTTPLHGATVIDAGCGTGILGIAALKLGAAKVFAYDIDEWSVRNAEDNYSHNALRAQICLGDASCLANAPQANILLANINRNILLADMPAFAKHLAPQGHLLLSGFYETDIDVLIDSATQQGLQYIDTQSDGEWRALHFIKP